MSYEKGDKFVLEIAEVFKSEDKTFYRAKNFHSLIFDENGLQKFRRIRETNEEAYERGYEDGKSEVDKERIEHHVVEPSAEQLSKARAAGAEEAWEFIQSVNKRRTLEYQWDMKREGLVYIRHDTCAEAKQAFEEWKAEEWEPKVGDVVMQGQFIGVVSTDPNKNGEVGVWWNTGGGGWEDIADLTPIDGHVDLNPIFEALK